MEWAKKEALQQSPFDTLNLKKEVWDKYLEGEYKLVCRVCSLGKVVAFIPNETAVPWDTWGRVFQVFGPCLHGAEDAGPREKPWRVLFFAAQTQRQLPEVGHPVGPEAVNGGYTFPCTHDSIVVYRQEEATRVLIHELFHAACTDRDLPLPEKEAETETWAEWTLVALASGGRPRAAAALFKKQLEWMAQCHMTLETRGIKDQNDYIWRYTLGREAAYVRLGARMMTCKDKRMTASSRLTHPDLEI